jgi:hypothetical protein
MDDARIADVSRLVHTCPSGSQPSADDEASGAGYPPFAYGRRALVVVVPGRRWRRIADRSTSLGAHGRQGDRRSPLAERLAFVRQRAPSRPPRRSRASRTSRATQRCSPHRLVRSNSASRSTKLICRPPLHSYRRPLCSRSHSWIRVMSTRGCWAAKWAISATGADVVLNE